MTQNLNELFEKHEDEFLKFERISSPLSKRPDVHAFLLLDTIVPPKRERDMVSATAHDEIYLDVDATELAAAITDEQARDLARCGVRYDSAYDSLCMFV